MMMDDPQSDMKNTLLSDVPASTQLSVLWKDKDGQEISKAMCSTDKPMLNTNLLQITVTNQVVVFDLKNETPQEKFYFNATQ